MINTNKKSFFSKTKHIVILRNTYTLCIGIDSIETNNRNDVSHRNALKNIEMRDRRLNYLYHDSIIT